jgi:hypothetical protein
MSVLVPGFSERVFEFSFNAEYADRNLAVLAGAPSIPTQNEEKWLGYDVAFELKRRGGAVHVVALQHKVPRYVDRRGPLNRHFWHAAGGAYFAVRLDTDQYNLIESISSANLPGVEFYFCAPAFATRMEMNSHYLGKSVEANSVWINVRSAGQINDAGLHTIVYSEDGSRAFRFSDEPVPLAISREQPRRDRWYERRNATFGEVELIYDTALKVLKDYWPRRRRTKVAETQSTFRLPDQLPNRGAPTIANTAKLLARYFGASVLVEVRK